MSKKKCGFDLYESMGSPKHIVAPMVDASELAWRMLARQYGADLCYTPMFHSRNFVRDAKYRRECMQTCPEDRPLVVQFCANDPDVFLAAVRYTVDMIDCDAVDLNLGCPQIIAKRGHFGAYLQDEWELLTKMISTVDKQVDIPITVKLRVFEDIDKTVAYAKMLEAAGAQIITVHGRTREQKGPLTGLASWKHIKAVRENVGVPVFANGNIQYLEDVNQCIRETGVQGVMLAESNLTNPALFHDLHPPVWRMSLEYLDLVEKYPCPVSFARGHLFKMLRHCLQIKTNFDLREVIAKAHCMDEFRTAVETLRDRYLPYENKEKDWIEPEEVKVFKLKYPPWICQPYVRPPPQEYIEKMKKVSEEAAIKQEAREIAKSSDAKRGIEDEHQGLSKKKLKQLQRNPNKKFLNFFERENNKKCKNCQNIAGMRCDYETCKKCCRTKCYDEELDCTGHKCLVKTHREAARARSLKNIVDNSNLAQET